MPIIEFQNLQHRVHSHPFTTLFSLIREASTFDLTLKHLDGTVTSSWSATSPMGLKQDCGVQSVASGPAGKAVEEFQVRLVVDTSCI